MCDIKIPTFWFDKDGVLAQYDYSIYEPENGAPAPWLIRNAHVFKNIDPYPNMVKAFRYLYQKNMNLSMYKRSINIRVLTSVSDGITLSEHILDGTEWCQRYLGLRQRDFYATAIPKENIPLILRNVITKFDVLFDDYMPNLRAWKDRGGTAVKILNGINSSTNDFPYFYNHAQPSYIAALLEQLASDIVSEKDIPAGQYTVNVEYVKAMEETFNEYDKLYKGITIDRDIDL